MKRVHQEGSVRIYSNEIQTGRKFGQVHDKHETQRVKITKRFSFAYLKLYVNQGVVKLQLAVRSGALKKKKSMSINVRRR